MRKTSKLWSYFQRALRAVSGLRRMCISLLSIAVSVAGIIEVVGTLYGKWQA